MANLLPFVRSTTLRGSICTRNNHSTTMYCKEAIFSLVVLVISVMCVNAQGPQQVFHGCPLVCPDGQVVNRTICECLSEPTLPPKPECRVISCEPSATQCLAYKWDDNGCRTCECIFRCPVRICPSNCPNGTEYFFDQFGCNACRCKQPRSCGETTCWLYCAEGYEKANNGCDTCRCKKCGNVCNLNCRFGKLVDVNGCELCECKPNAECRRVCSNEVCENGRVLDKYGCPTCQCVSKTPCGPACHITCNYGILYDKYGCSTCKCARNSYCRPRCNNTCPLGDVYDENDCPTCTC